VAEATPGGLLDKLLDLRAMPDAKVLLYRLSQAPEDLIESDPEADAVYGWRAGIDAAMDVVVPALKSIVMMPGGSCGSTCLPKVDVESLIGRVPLTRSDRQGWR
jgi:hypothetical protein